MNFKLEYIACAANHYLDIELIRTDLPHTHLYPINISSGIVFCGYRHLHCLYVMIAMTGKKQHQAGKEIQGFLTSKNRFVDREEAAKIAIACGQISKLQYSNKDLYSEDLY